MTGFVERLQQLVSEHRSANSFAKSTGIGQSLLRKYLAGGTPGMDKIVQIAKATNVSVEWLVTGEGQRDRDMPMSQMTGGTQREHEAPAMRQSIGTGIQPNSDFVTIPRYEVQASAGSGLVSQGDRIRDFLAFDAGYLRAIGIDPRQAHMVQVEGRSMVPTLVDGEWVIVDTSATGILNGMIYTVVYQGSVLVKRLRREDGAIILISDNKAEGYVDDRVDGIDLDELRIVGRVRRHIRAL